MKNNIVIDKLIKKVEIDLKTIENLLKMEDSPPESICFHAQQAIEKSLKAYLQFLEIPYKLSHDLDYLIELIVPENREFEKYFDIADELTPYAVSIRYETEIGDFSNEDAIFAYEKALEIKNIIFEKIQKA